MNRSSGISLHGAPAYVAGVLEEYGRDRPSTSKAELMVLALSATSVPSTPAMAGRYRTDVRVHPTTGSSARTRMADNVKSLLLRDFTDGKRAFE